MQITQAAVASIVFSFFASLPLASASGRIVGNGGMGIVRNGQVITVGADKIPVEKMISAQNIPGLQGAIDTVNSLQLSGDVKSRLLDALTPSVQRQYFWINESDIKSRAYKKILTNYRKLYHLSDSEQFTLFAVTQNTDTYLVQGANDISHLDSVGQATILFHEAIWVYDADLSPENVISLETAFESYLRKSNDVRIYFEIGSLLKPYRLAPVLQSYIDHDMKDGALQGLVEESADGATISGKILFGDSLSDGAAFDSDLNVDKWLVHLQELSASHPSSLLIRFLIQVGRNAHCKLTLTAEQTYALQMKLQIKAQTSLSYPDVENSSDIGYYFETPSGDNVLSFSPSKGLSPAALLLNQDKVDALIEGRHVGAPELF